MPSYLSSTQTVGPSRPMISAASSAGDASMNLSGWNRASSALAERVVAGQHGRPADVAGEHPGPLHVVERPVEGLGDGRLEEPLAQADPQLAGQDLDDVPWPSAGSRARQQRRAGSPPWRAGPEAASISAIRGGDLGGVVGRSIGSGGGGRCARPPARAHRRRPGPGRTTGRRPRRGRPAGTSAIAATAAADRRPAEAGRRAGRPRRTGRPAGRRPRSAARSASSVRRYSARSGVFSEVRVVAATRSASSLQRRMAGMVYRAGSMVHRSVVPGSDWRATASSCGGTSRANLAAFMRWYADPEVARLTRYQDGADAPRGDRALLRGPGPRARMRWRWRSTSRRPTG